MLTKPTKMFNKKNNQAINIYIYIMHMIFLCKPLPHILSKELISADKLCKQTQSVFDFNYRHLNCVFQFIYSVLFSIHPLVSLHFLDFHVINRATSRLPHGIKLKSAVQRPFHLLGRLTLRWVFKGPKCVTSLTKQQSSVINAMTRKKSVFMDCFDF